MNIAFYFTLRAYVFAWKVKNLQLIAGWDKNLSLERDDSVGPIFVKPHIARF